MIDVLFYTNNSFNDKNLNCVDLVFLDLSNAFDSITFQSILENCHKIGLRDNCLKLLESYLFNRKQFVYFNNEKSDNKLITSGVPQGGHESPDLFNISIFDLLKIVNFSQIFQYADDICLIKPIHEKNDVNLLQTDLNSIHNYCIKKNLSIYSSKSVHLRISLKKCEIISVYKINNEVIPINSEHKHLGFIIEDKLSFNSHINYIYNNSISKWAFLKKICPKINPYILLKLYKIYILPIIEYCNVCLILNVSQNQKIESIQKKITKQICLKLN